jgi:perosamine synthetase
MSNKGSMNISISGPDITDAEVEAVNQVLCSPSLSMGPFIELFETRLASYVGCRYGIAVNSGTAGLHLATIAAGIEEGDEVITTPFSFIASANCILYERGHPIFVDIDPNTMNIDTEKIESAITPRTKAILPVHVFGLPCNMDKIMDLAQKYDLIVIEDACEALGAEWRGNKAGTFGDCGVFAFYPNKQMTTGEGGMIVTDREDLNDLFRSLRNQGRDKNGTWLHHIRLGYNYRLDEMSAALGYSQIERIDELLTRRENVARLYNEKLADVPGVALPQDTTMASRSWFVYVIRLDPELDRDIIIRELQDRGVPTRPYFAPIHTQPFYMTKFGYHQGNYPITESISRTTLALPFHNGLSNRHIDFVVDTLTNVLEINS